MPTYEYECKTCDYHFEAFQSMRDNPLQECPKCGKEIRRLINGGSGIIFKGSGFYVNDGKRGEKKPSSSETNTAASAPCSGCAKAEGGSCPGSQAAS